MGALGVLSSDDRVELLEGWIVPKMTHHPPHALALSRVELLLPPLLNTDWYLRTQRPLRTADSSPEPDAAVVRGPMERYGLQHPGKGDVAIVVEVADSSLKKDRRKARIYASIDVPVYWIVNLVDRQLELYTRPLAEKRQYQERRILAAQDRIEVQIDGKTCGEFTVEEFLPPSGTPVVPEID
jgi:hypothetical protein